MTLPENQKPIRVEYHFVDDNKKVVKYFIEGKMLENFEKNLRSSGYFCFTHGVKFLPVEWDK